MSATREMGSARRRPIPGMVSKEAQSTADPAVELEDAGGEHGPAARAAVQSGADRRVESSGVPQPRSVDYGATRLVNFRLPVDLHDRFRVLVREAEERHPRLRRASLTELLIALLEEAPQTADEVAELIRRKRLAEHEER